MADRPASPVRRSAAAPEWPSGVTDAFHDDAFATLEGPRPDFRSAGPGRADATGGSPAAAGPYPPSRTKWSALISEATLTDEIKDMKGVVTAATSRPTEFKGGGYERSREAFGMLSLAFAVIADYEQDVRWKRDAANARDVFAATAAACDVGTDESLAEALLGVEDLESLLDGTGARRRADVADGFVWNRVASRSTLMERLKAAEAGIDAGIAAQADFAKAAPRLIHEAELAAAIAEVITMPDFEDHDDETYRGHSERMRDAALGIRAACEQRDYEAARAAAAAVKKSCDACHADYRG